MHCRLVLDYKDQRKGVYRMEMKVEKLLLNVEESSKYLNIGKTKCREFIREHEHEFVISIGNRKYINKPLLDQWIERQSRM